MHVHCMCVQPQLAPGTDLSLCGQNKHDTWIHVHVHMATCHPACQLSMRAVAELCGLKNEAVWDGVSARTSACHAVDSIRPGRSMSSSPVKVKIIFMSRQISAVANKPHLAELVGRKPCPPVLPLCEPC
jgi:hypothetical protein